MGTFFTIADFSGTGDLSTATGFRLDGVSGAIDPFVMVAVIPEPGTLALIGIAFGALLLGARRKRA
ncbi:MAG: PEP-CTERM sorting domain-containing protein [Kiritimatiellia bacterium]